MIVPRFLLTPMASIITTIDNDDDVDDDNDDDDDDANCYFCGPTVHIYMPSSTPILILILFLLRQVHIHVSFRPIWMFLLVIIMIIDNDCTFNDSVPIKRRGVSRIHPLILILFLPLIRMLVVLMLLLIPIRFMSIASVSIATSTPMILILVSYRIISFHPIIRIMMIRFDTDTDTDTFRVLRFCWFCFVDPSNSRPSMFPLLRSK